MSECVAGSLVWLVTGEVGELGVKIGAGGGIGRNGSEWVNKGKGDRYAEEMGHDVTIQGP